MRKRRLTAKHAFTAWAAVVYAFLFLPILVMAVFAFNKPSPAALAGFRGSNICLTRFMISISEAGEGHKSSFGLQASGENSMTAFQPRGAAFAIHSAATPQCSKYP